MTRIKKMLWLALVLQLILSFFYILTIWDNNLLGCFLVLTPYLFLAFAYGCYRIILSIAEDDPYEVDDFPKVEDDKPSVYESCDGKNCKWFNGSGVEMCMNCGEFHY